ncbi:hypothetical protein GCM10010912_56560 [Paenibacillus albidus]|uniref:SDR family NAD(P)-dependent oxidoreductase n=1 Tax=Paenibacillus albidus TaxID=2041023 RepID=A0A917D1Q5_9BACL|nr:hypothetical protein GCM10010912_56560 [Paenibacillus albidus]
MKTMVIIGAGPGLGFSLAKIFGRHGFRIAMVSRTQEKLDHMLSSWTGLVSKLRVLLPTLQTKYSLPGLFKILRVHSVQ